MFSNIYCYCNLKFHAKVFKNKKVIKEYIRRGFFNTPFIIDITILIDEWLHKTISNPNPHLRLDGKNNKRQISNDNFFLLAANSIGNI